MRLENVQTFARIHTHKRTLSQFADQSLSVDGSQVTLLTDVAKGQSKVVGFDKVYGADGQDVFLTRQSIDNLVNGISVGIFKIGGLRDDEEQSDLFASILDQLKSQLGESTTMSYGLYSLSDSHCTDLTSLTQLDPDSVRQIVQSPTAELEPVSDLDDVLEIIQNGYPESCLLFLRLRTEEQGSVYCSTLAVGDLCNGLDRSIALLKNIALSLEQPYANGALPFEQSRLTTFMEPFLSTGTCKFLFCLENQPAGVETKALLSVLSLAEALKKVKCRPTPVIEAPEVRELQKLLSTSAELETLQQATKKQAKGLRKDLVKLNGERAKLLDDLTLSASETQVSVWEREYQKAQLALENLTIQDQLRQCEANLVWMDHQRAMLDAEVFEVRYKCEQVQLELAHKQDESAQREEEFEAEVETLRENLAKSTKDLETTVQRLEKESREQGKTADYKVAQLEAKLSHTEANRKKLEGDLEEINRKWSQDRRQLGEQEKKYADEAKAAIAKAKAEELVLQSEIKELDQHRRKADSTISDLQREIGNLRIENASLSAKLDVYTRFSQQQIQQAMSPRKSDAQIKLALAKIEEKIGQERTEMMSMIQALKPIEKLERAVLALPKKKPVVVQSLPKKHEPIVPVKRSKKRAEEMEDEYGPESGAEDAPEPPVVVAVEKTIKLKPKKQPVPAKENKEPAPQLFVKKNTPIDAIPKSAMTSHAPPPVQSQQPPIPQAPKESPIKAKSAFIPGKTVAKPKFLANMNFGGSSAAPNGTAQPLDPNRKRIKLPERSIGSTLGPAQDQAAQLHTRRNIDPAVYSAIVSNFSVKK